METRLYLGNTLRGRWQWVKMTSWLGNFCCSKTRITKNLSWKLFYKNTTLQHEWQYSRTLTHEQALFMNKSVDEQNSSNNCVLIHEWKFGSWTELLALLSVDIAWVILMVLLTRLKQLPLSFSYVCKRASAKGAYKQASPNKIRGKWNPLLCQSPTRIRNDGKKF